MRLIGGSAGMVNDRYSIVLLYTIHSIQKDSTLGQRMRGLRPSCGALRAVQTVTI